ncbi:hypothetical protein DFR45_1236 [Extensimonas vulgaris]|uniref:Uncharacterized protein n=1 Tax=Extensimonas vulgaris TaxID=1031594 RepID=A0A369ABZ4_9BURK|nr:hypothetical protein DFR45_1236 [Extensimonas vulgaris]
MQSASNPTQFNIGVLHESVIVNHDPRLALTATQTFQHMAQPKQIAMFSE